jgi:hypothetical protein
VSAHPSHRLIRVATAVLGLLTPRLLYAQPVHVDGRIAFASHGASACRDTLTSGLAAGVEVHTSGRWIASAAVDVFFNHSYACLDILPLTDYNGEQAEVWGNSEFTSPRASLAFGVGGSGSLIGYELTVGAGTIGTSTSFGSGGTIGRWQPWHGAALTVRWVASGFGLQVEAGRHRVADRFYSRGQVFLLGERLRWAPLIRFGATYSLF